MGVKENITADAFPRQGTFLGKTVEVMFHYNTSRAFPATVVRDDVDDPFVTILALDDGRYVLATECQYSLPKDS